MNIPFTSLNKISFNPVDGGGIDIVEDSIIFWFDSCVLEYLGSNAGLSDRGRDASRVPAKSALFDDTKYYLPQSDWL
jgi:hypothetical protein